MTGVELEEISRMVRRVFAKHQRRVGFGRAGDDTVADLDDVQQVAAIAIWEHFLRKRLPLNGRRTLYYQVGARAAGKHLRRVRSPMKLTDHAIDKMGMTGDVSEGYRVPIVGCGWTDEDLEHDEAISVVNPPGADVASARIAARDARRARAELLTAADAAGRVALGRSLAAIGRRLVGLTARGLSIADVARKTGRSRETVRKIGTRFRQAIRRDPAVRALRRAMIEDMEMTS